LKVEITSSGRGNTEINAIGVSKANAIEFLCKYLNIELNSVMPIGDNDNDISMLTLSNHSVTLASSKQEVKSAASHVIEASEGDVVAYAINDFIINPLE